MATATGDVEAMEVVNEFASVRVRKANAARKRCKHAEPGAAPDRRGT